MIDVILNKLLDRYESSILSKGGSTRNISIEINPTQILKTYGTSRDISKTLLLNESVEDLIKDNLVVIKTKGNAIHRIGLNLDKLHKAYGKCKRIPKKEHEEKVIAYLKTVHTLESEYLLNRLTNYQSIKSYFTLEDLVELKDILKLTEFIKLNDDYISYRKASQKLFFDSKRLENILNSSLRLIKDANEFDDEKDILIKSKLEKNPDFIYLKGNAILSINDQMIDLNKIDGGLGLHSKTIDKINIISKDIKHIFSIENLTSYHDFNSDESLIIYLGGYHNTLKENFIKKIYQSNPTAKYYHFGDLDPDGVEIYLNLKSKTNIPFEMFMMDKETYFKYKAYGKPLEKTNITKIHQLKKRCNFEILDLMLEHQIKIEQEIIEVV